MLAWNVRKCACGDLMDFRASACRDCFLKGHRAGSEKFCSGCSSTLPIDRFWRRSNGRIISRCKSCCIKPRVSTPEQRAARIKKRSVRFETDLSFRMGFVMSARIRSALKSQGLRRSRQSRAVLLLGCSIEAFRSKIESLWLPGMSWDNWGAGEGRWHLDHKRPVSSFILSDPDQLAVCFHYTNYQPLWAPDNLKKGASWEPLTNAPNRPTK